MHLIFKANFFNPESTQMLNCFSNFLMSVIIHPLHPGNHFGKFAVIHSSVSTKVKYYIYNVAAGIMGIALEVSQINKKNAAAHFNYRVYEIGHTLLYPHQSHLQIVFLTVLYICPTNIQCPLASCQALSRALEVLIEYY